MRWALEVIVVPVSDVDRAKAFYRDQVGFLVDQDTSFGAGTRIVQLTPPGTTRTATAGPCSSSPAEPTRPSTRTRYPRRRRGARAGPR
jgi:catechol 2,3-dioxygenase-like lactoylglutathione lyase family enzyme